MLSVGQIVVCHVPALQSELSLKKQHLNGPSIGNPVLVAAEAGQRTTEFDCMNVQDYKAT
jgi:hypothetical protein